LVFLYITTVLIYIWEKNKNNISPEKAILAFCWNGMFIAVFIVLLARNPRYLNLFFKRFKRDVGMADTYRFGLV